MRADLPTGFAAAQISHATAASIEPPLDPRTNVVVLGVPNLDTIHNLGRALDVSGINYSLICEPDQPYDGQATAIGICPVLDRASLKKLLSNLPLYMGQRQRKVSTPQADCVQSQAGPPCADSLTTEHQE